MTYCPRSPSSFCVHVPVAPRRRRSRFEEKINSDEVREYFETLGHSGGLELDVFCGFSPVGGVVVSWRLGSRCFLRSTFSSVRAGFFPSSWGDPQLLVFEDVSQLDSKSKALTFGTPGASSSFWIECLSLSGAEACPCVTLTSELAHA